MIVDRSQRDQKTIYDALMILHEIGGTERVIAFIVGEFTRMLREDIATKFAERGRETRR